MHLPSAASSIYAFVIKKGVIQAGIQHSLTRSEMRTLIDERIFHALDRQILSRKILDGATFEQIAEEVGRSVNCVKYRYRDALTVLCRFLT